MYLRLFSNHKTIFNVFIVIFVLWKKLLHMTYVYSCYVARAFIRWTTEVFTVFIDTNITIMCLLFIFRRTWIILFALSIISTQSLFIFNCAHSCFFVVLQFLRLYCFVDVSNCLLTCPIASLSCLIVLLELDFKKLGQMHLYCFIILGIYLIIKK